MHTRFNFEQRVLLWSFLTGLPGTVLAALLIIFGHWDSPILEWTVVLGILLFWLGFAFTLHRRVVAPMQVLANLLAALREGDYSIRAREAQSGDALGEVMLEVNALGEILKGQRLDAVEATALLRTVMAEIVDVAVFAFDNEQKLRLVNRAGERLLGQPSPRLLGRSAGDLKLADCLDGEPARTLQLNFPGGTGRWGMRRSLFREGGLPHHLLVLTDLSRALREEERQAWQRLLRVLGHELNNSLAPIKSLAGSLEKLASREPKPDDWKEDMQRGLSVISGRAEALNRFMEAYTRVARLPQPKLKSVSVAGWIQRVAGLETRLRIETKPGPELTIQADGDQLDQLLINLVRNAVDAVIEVADQTPRSADGETGLGVRLGWTRTGEFVEVDVQDDGPGLSNTANLFVPFFTTKRGGSGIGLVLCRQIAEAHGGSLDLQNRTEAHGCVARLRLPI